MSDFVVEVKRSARRTNAAVGAAVCQQGTRWEFDSRAGAEAWAASLSKRDTNTVWIRTADPADSSPVDGYLVSRTRPSTLDGAYDKRRRRLNPPSRDQPELSQYDSPGQ